MKTFLFLLAGAALGGGALFVYNRQKNKDSSGNVSKKDNSNNSPGNNDDTHPVLGGDADKSDKQREKENQKAKDANYQFTYDGPDKYKTLAKKIAIKYQAVKVKYQETMNTTPPWVNVSPGAIQLPTLTDWLVAYDAGGKALGGEKIMHVLN
jgi:hypothetical protein